MKAIYNLLLGNAEFDESIYDLGRLCKKNHQWQSSGLSLRLRSDGKCVQCRREWYEANKEEQQRKARERMNNRNANLTDEQRIAKNEKQNNHWRSHGRPSRAKRYAGAKVIVIPGHHRVEVEMQQSIRNAGRCPSVARLVMDEQLRYWREYPEAKREHGKQWKRTNWWLRYQINPDLRLYIRQKSKRRKALLRQQTAHQIKPRVIRARFRQFDNCCAYCEDAGDMQIEHVVPISKGGTHAIGNIVPACQSCNYSKRAHEVESWYRAQPFYSDLRWRKICRVLGWSRSSIGQLALL